MGTWGTGIFANDEALDWTEELLDSSDFGLVERSLSPEEIKGYYLEAPACVRVLCAAEVIAALLGRGSPELPEEAQSWVAENPRSIEPELIAKATARVHRVLAEHSELRELWEENQADFPIWQKTVIELAARLSGN